MQAHLFMKKQKNENTGFWNTNFALQGVGLNGTVPIRVCYFGKPVMEPVMEKVMDPLTGKPKLDKDKKEILVEKKDEAGNTVMAPKKDKEGKEILRDEDFSVRVELLEMYSGNLKDGVFCNPVDVLASRSSEVEGEYNYFVQCWNVKIPIEVPDFSTDDRPDYGYRANKAKLRLIATNA